MLLEILLSASLLQTGLSWPHVQRATNLSAWDINNFQNLITFGDSYTDENRLNYFIANNGSVPPPGTFLPESFRTYSGGRIWARYVVQYTGVTTGGQWTPKMTLYDYAVAGASCSNEVTLRTFNISRNNPFVYPSVLEYQIPAFKNDTVTYRNGTTATPYFSPTPLTPTNSIYVLWVGTNDLGVNAFLTDSQVRGKTLTSYTDCIYTALDSLYALGARHIVLINTVPLELAPLYSNTTLNGSNSTGTNYWPAKPSFNLTATSETIRESTTTVNEIFRYRSAFETLVANRYPDAAWALFDAHSLVADMYAHPELYLNGTVKPLVVDQAERNSVAGRTVYGYNGTSPDSFLWYDVLHLSQQAQRVIARTFVDVISGSSPYATYY